MDRWVADSGLSKRFPIYTRANVGEVFPDPVTPLTRDCGITNAELGWRDAWVRMGAFDADEFDPDDLEQLGIVGGYCYLNASLARVFGERAPGLSAQVIDDQFFGAQPGIPSYESEARPSDVRPDLTEKIGATFGWVLTTDSLPELLDDQALTKRLRDGRPDYTTMSVRELAEHYVALMDGHFRRLFEQHIFITYMATLPAGIITGVCTAIGAPELALRLMAGIGGVDSAAPSLALWDLSRLPAGSAEFDAGFAAFLHEFGSRGPNEWESRSPSWETDPQLALVAIDRMRQAPDSMAPSLQNQARAAEREALAAEIAAKLAADPDTQAQFLAGVHAATVFLPGRERTKTNAIRLIHECRMPLREIGRRMVALGHFDEIEDFGMLRKDELIGAFPEHPEQFTEVIRTRRADYATLSSLEPPFVFSGAPAPVETWPVRGASPVELAVVGAALQGYPGCPGVAEGRARVILDSHDPSALEPGDILVAPITDPSWTPLFVPAAAVVVDVGAALSHAIIVSRELGIPCVVSVTDATRRIPDGARIRVDGDTGAVTVLEGAA